jgi:hypothetical protein
MDPPNSSMDYGRSRQSGGDRGGMHDRREALPNPPVSTVPQPPLPPGNGDCPQILVRAAGIHASKTG